MSHPLLHPRHHHHKHHPHPVPQPAPAPSPAPMPAPSPAPQPTGAIQWPAFNGQAQFVGTSDTQMVSIYVDPTLGQPGLDNAHALLADADRIGDLNDSIFGLSPNPMPVNVIIYAINGQTDGTGGADHAACNFSQGGNIEVCAAFGKPPMLSALFMAELSECAMNGQLCGLSTGEALSRWCAMVTDNGSNPLAEFATAPAWVNAGMPDFVNQTEATDQDPASIGCGMAFISWLLSKPGVTLPLIAQDIVALADGGTLADVYAKLLLRPATDAWPAFKAALDVLPGPITSDDPFGALASAVTTA